MGVVIIPDSGGGPHAIASATHLASTLEQFNDKVSDQDIIGSLDPRLAVPEFRLQYITGNGTPASGTFTANSDDPSTWTAIKLHYTSLAFGNFDFIDDLNDGDVIYMRTSDLTTAYAICVFNSSAQDVGGAWTTLTVTPAQTSGTFVTTGQVDIFVIPIAGGGTGQTDLTNITTNVLPTTSNNLDIGSTAKLWRNIYAHSLQSHRLAGGGGSEVYAYGMGALRNTGGDTITTAWAANGSIVCSGATFTPGDGVAVGDVALVLNSGVNDGAYFVIARSATTLTVAHTFRVGEPLGQVWVYAQGFLQGLVSAYLSAAAGGQAEAGIVGPSPAVLIGSARSTSTGYSAITASSGGHVIGDASTSSTGSAVVEAFGGTAIGQAQSSGAKHGVLAATAAGATAIGGALGIVQTASLKATGIGATALGYAFDFNGLGTASSDIVASGSGAVAMGAAFLGKITASGAGSIAVGYGNANREILASGEGSGAFGSTSTAAITASGVNSFQFGEGTNSANLSLSIGGGIRIHGFTTGTPSTLRNGDIWVSASKVWIRTNGVTKDTSLMT